MASKKTVISNLKSALPIYSLLLWFCTLLTCLLPVQALYGLKSFYPFSRFSFQGRVCICYGQRKNFSNPEVCG